MSPKPAAREAEVARTIVLAVAMLAALIGQSQAQAQSPKPTYCSGPGAYRLSECGLTEKQAREAEAAAAAKRSPTGTSSNTDAAYQWLSQQAKSLCDRPISKMSLDDIEDCNKPGMRALRER